jgi:hypothetical protein
MACPPPWPWTEIVTVNHRAYSGPLYMTGKGREEEYQLQTYR